MSHVLVTGGAGYIGSHTVLHLLETGHEVTVVDNLSNSSAESLVRVRKLSGKDVRLHEFDVQDEAKLSDLFAQNSFDAVIHFAGLKAVGESMQEPLRYYQNNLDSTLVLCTVMEKYGVRKIVFSSSATVYGDPEHVPIPEDAPVHAANPYGQTKAMIERILLDVATANDTWRVALLRYFNPIGAHESGQIGEDPDGVPNNLMPFISQVAVGKLEEVQVFGDDWPTPDGTGVRDYIHVVDLAAGHLAALEHLPEQESTEVYNLGTGHGVSVLEVIKAFEAACDRPIPYRVVGRRFGDVASYYADATKAEQQLGWKALKTLQQACEDTWRWQSNNPNGYNQSKTGDNA